MINRLSNLITLIKYHHYLPYNTLLIEKDKRKPVTITQNPQLYFKIFYYTSDTKDTKNEGYSSGKYNNINQRTRSLSQIYTELKQKLSNLQQLFENLRQNKLKADQISDLIAKAQKIISELVVYIDNIKNDKLNKEDKTFIMRFIYRVLGKNRLFSIHSRHVFQNIDKIIMNERLAHLLIQNYTFLNIRQKSMVLNFFNIYHIQNKLLMTLLKKNVQNSKTFINFSNNNLANDIIQFFKQVSFIKKNSIARDLTLNQQFVKHCNRYVMMNLSNLQPKSVINFIKFRDNIQLDRNNLAKYVQDQYEKIQKQKNSDNLYKIVHLIRILAQLPMISPQKQQKQGTQIRDLAYKMVSTLNQYYKTDQDQQLHQQNEQNQEGQQKKEKQSLIKKQLNKKQQKKSISPGNKAQQNQIRRVQINLLFQSLIKMYIIDYKFFAVLERMFFQENKTIQFFQVEQFIQNKLNLIKLIKANINKAQESDNSSKEGQNLMTIRRLKNSHKAFVERLIIQLININKFTLREIFNALNLCQKVPIKSRKLKRAIQQMAQEKEKIKPMSEEQKAIIQSMISQI